jgi:hypothetical protein
MLKNVAVITTMKNEFGDRYVRLHAVDFEAGEAEYFREYGTSETPEQIRIYLKGLYPDCTILDNTVPRRGVWPT